MQSVSNYYWFTQKRVRQKKIRSLTFVRPASEYRSPKAGFLASPLLGSIVCGRLLVVLRVATIWLVNDSEAIGNAKLYETNSKARVPPQVNMDYLCNMY